MSRGLNPYTHKPHTLTLQNRHINKHLLNQWYTIRRFNTSTDDNNLIFICCHTYIHTYVHIYMYIYLYLYIYLYIYNYTYTYIYKHTHTHTHTETELIIQRAPGAARWIFRWPSPPAWSKALRLYKP